MKLAWLLPDHSCDRQQFGDLAAQLGLLAQQGYPVCRTLLVSTGWWQHYQSVLNANSIAALIPGNSTTLAAVQDAIQSTLMPQSWLIDLTTAIRQLQTPTIVLHPVLVTAEGIPLSLQDLWRSQLSANTTPALTLALKKLWATLLHPHSLRCYQHLQLTWSQLQVAILIQPVQSMQASGRLLYHSGQWQLEAIWGLGYRWLTNLVYPDYYAGPVADFSTLTHQHQGSKHQILHLTPHSQLHRDITQAAQQNQWVLSISEIRHLLKLLVKPKSWQGELLWQRLPNGEFEVTHGRALSNPTPDLATLALDAKANVSGASLQGQGVVPGSAVGSLAIVTPQTQVLPPNQILVATTLQPHQIALLGEAAGLILEQGSATSHSVIVARELQIPTVIGVTNAIAQLQTTRTVMLAADQGRVYLQGASTALNDPPAVELSVESSQPPTRVSVWGACNHPHTITVLNNQTVDGVGLVRSELLLMSLHPDWANGHVPNADQVQAQLQTLLLELAAAVTPRPLFYRFADWRSPKFPPLPGQAALPGDGLLGQRGVYAAQCNPWLFDLELAALKVVLTEYSQIRLILPFVRRVSEFVWVRDRLQDKKLPPTQLWIMAETPAIAFDIEAYQAAGVQGVAIGLNDLMQLTLGIDRDVHNLVEPGDLAHPAVQATIKHLIQQAHHAHLPCSLCATIDWSHHQTLVNNWVKWGLDAVVTELNAVGSARQAIAQAETID
ncbi:MAG: hypothetical protein F6J87_05655 [Spirulina sp. SIO3F2]|nr:hypothetical protein [Spirulina sp. SIO3F2]